jgi:hypothetical protein
VLFLQDVIHLGRCRRSLQLLAIQQLRLQLLKRLPSLDNELFANPPVAP